MNEETFKQYKKHYEGAMVAVIAAVATPIISMLINIGTFSGVQEIMIILVIYNTYKASKLPDFPDKKPMGIFVAIWCGILIAGTANLFYQISINEYYLVDDSFDPISWIFSIASIIMVVIISVKCYQNLKKIKAIKNGEEEKINNVELDI